MKKIILLVMCILVARTMQAQTFAEWFQQNKTQKKYLAEQIVALQAYAVVLKKGYDVAHKGLGVIGDIKNGDLNLHSLYFSSLKAVNPEISKYPRVGDILTIQQNIQSLASSSKSKAAQNEFFTASERDYINSVYSRLNDDCLATLSDLDVVTTPGKLEMKDDERLKRIDKLYAESQSQYGFAKNFSANLSVMQLQKSKTQTDLQTIHIWYGIQ
jgi:hypothetical protein